MDRCDSLQAIAIKKQRSQKKTKKPKNFGCPEERQMPKIERFDLNFLLSSFFSLCLCSPSLFFFLLFFLFSLFFFLSFFFFSLFFSLKKLLREGLLG